MTPLDQASAILKAAEEATPGPWYVDTIKNEGGDGSYNSYQLQISMPFKWTKTLADSVNADECEIHTECDEDSIQRWDEAARRNFEFIALARNTAPAIATALIEKHRALEECLGLLKAINEAFETHKRDFFVCEKCHAQDDFAISDSDLVLIVGEKLEAARALLALKERAHG